MGLFGRPDKLRRAPVPLSVHHLPVPVRGPSLWWARVYGTGGEVMMGFTWSEDPSVLKCSTGKFFPRANSVETPISIPRFSLVSAPMASNGCKSFQTRLATAQGHGVCYVNVICACRLRLVPQELPLQSHMGLPVGFHAHARWGVCDMFMWIISTERHNATVIMGSGVNHPKVVLF